MDTGEAMRHRLERAFAPTRLLVEDRSEEHRGHGGWQEGGGTHWHVAIRAPLFKAMSRVERHRAVHAALGPEVMGRIHALSLDVAG